MVAPRLHYPSRVGKGQGAAGRLQRPQEGDEILLLLRAQVEVEARVVEVDGVQQRCGRTIVEVGRARGQTAKDRTFELPDVGTLSGDEGASWVGGLNRLRRVGQGPGGADQGVERLVRRSPGGVGDPDV